MPPGRSVVVKPRHTRSSAAYSHALPSRLFRLFRLMARLSFRPAGVVEPDNVVVFYPTRYDVDEVAPRIACPVAAFFAEHDVLPGATVEDAQALRETLRENENVSRKTPICPRARRQTLFVKEGDVQVR